MSQGPYTDPPEEESNRPHERPEWRDLPPSQRPRPPVRGPRRPTPRRGRSVWAVVATILLVLSALANVFLFLLLIAAVSFGGAEADALRQHVVREGNAGRTIVVIRVEGVIFDEMVEGVARRIRRAAEDDDVKAVILRINSPGGSLTATDQIFHLLQERLEGKPIVAAMESVAASGGYYVACSAEKVLAQPTTITGSIGVIAQFFFLEGLMQDKLGVTPVTLKKGEQKDWPNIWTDKGLTDAQRDYLMETLLDPGYERFVEVVQEGRGLDPAEVRRLATGRIFLGPEAQGLGLVDEVGYFEQAVEAAEALAGITEARVIEYRDIPTLADVLSLGLQARSPLEDLRPENLAALASPKRMYLWTGY